MARRIFLDSFSGAAAMLPRAQRNANCVLAALAKHPYVSTWDMEELPWLRNIIADLKQQGLITSQDEPYPWLRYKLTEAGKKALGLV